MHSSLDPSQLSILTTSLHNVEARFRTEGFLARMRFIFRITI
jgi:hypothetical protein